MALTCWLARHDGESRWERAVTEVGAMAVYNTGVAIVLAYASIGLAAIQAGAFGPRTCLTRAMTVWCLKTSQ